MRCFLLLIAIIISQVYCFQNNGANTKQYHYQKLRLSMANKNKKKPSTTSKGNSSDMKTGRSVMLDEKLKEKKEFKTMEELLYDELKLVYETKSYSDDLELKSMIALDVGKADTFWDATFPRIKKIRINTSHEKELQKKLDMDKHFIDLMNYGFDRRLVQDGLVNLEQQQQSSSVTIQPNSNPHRLTNIIKSSALLTSTHLELSTSREEQIEAMKRKQMLRRSGPMKLVPQPFHKYIDFLTSLRKDPLPGEMVRNLGVSAVFSLITMINARARMAFIYSCLGNIAVMSILLTRNMPEVKVPLGMDKNKVVSWAPSSFKSAVGVTALFSLSTAFLLSTLLAIVPTTLSMSQKLRLIMAGCVLGAGYFTSFYEVFEEKDKDGSRWKKAIEGFGDDVIQSKLKKQVAGDDSLLLYDTFSFQHNPQIDEYPPLPKYIDEVDGSQSVNLEAGNSGDHDEIESKDHFEKWNEVRKEARRAPITEAQPEDKWVGGKAGMYVKSLPAWLTAAYKKHVLKGNSWRDLPSKFVKDTSGDIKPIYGPLGFRDKRPEWLDIFGSGVWEEKITTSRKVARAFGTYRKTMFKLDKRVELLPCDGADK